MLSCELFAIVGAGCLDVCFSRIPADFADLVTGRGLAFEQHESDRITA
jgi:hypothetical protein